MPQTEKGRATRQRIVDVATRLIVEHGVAAVSLDDVGREARVSRSQLYHYFDDKADLLRAVVVSTIDLVLAAQGGHLEALDTWAAIDRWFAHLLALPSDPPSGCRWAPWLPSSPADGRPRERSWRPASSVGRTTSPAD